MATDRYARNGIIITTYAGPANEIAPNTNSRIRVQITNTVSGQFVQMSLDQWVDHVCFIREMDARNEGLLTKGEEELSWTT